MGNRYIKSSARSSILDPRSSIFHSRSSTRGFSFAEVMFAVVILGIGFILIAAIFPVAIQQSQVTGEESNAAAIARQAAIGIATITANTSTTMVTPQGSSVTSQAGTIANPAYNPSQKLGPLANAQTDCETVIQYPIFPPTVKNYMLGSGGYSPQQVSLGTFNATVQPTVVPPPAVVLPLVGSRWDLFKANAILPNDPRFAYAAFYKRENNSSFVELIVVAMTVRNHPVYDPTADVTSLSQTVSITTTPAVFPTQGQMTTICPDTVSVNSNSSLLGEGSCLQIPPGFGGATLPVGRTYTLGQSLTQSVFGPTFELMPGDGMALTAGSGGLWGTAGRITDASTPSQSATLNSSGTLQATVAYAITRSDPDSPGGRIFLASKPFALNQPPVPKQPSAPGPLNPPPAAAVTGAFVIVADDFPNPMSGNSTSTYSLTPNLPGYFSVGSLNGRIFRLGKAVTEDLNEASGGRLLRSPPGTFDLDPQYGMRPPLAPNPASADLLPNPYIPAASSVAAKVYIIGAGKDPTTGNVSGPAQDIGVFATYFQVQ